MTAEILDDPSGREHLPEHAVLGRYRLVQRLGEGGMGVVHLALDRQGRAVAIKVLRPHVALDPAARARLSREVETLSRVRSPRVAPVIDADVDGERPYIVTRYVPGEPLDDLVAQDGPLGPDALHRLGSGLAEALDAIHGCDVIHRDLKPGNVLVVDGDPVLIDFGIAHVADDVRLTMTGLVMGTPGYLAPEVVEGSPVSRATDWWGWAATLAYAASGTPPFGRGSMDAVLTRVTAGDADLSRVDPRIAPLLYAALAPEPSDRPHEREVVAALERYSRGGLVTDVIDVRPRAAGPATESLSVPRTSVLPLARSRNPLSRNRSQRPFPPVAAAVAPASAPAVDPAPTRDLAPTAAPTERTALPRSFDQAPASPAESLFGPGPSTVPAQGRAPGQEPARTAYPDPRAGTPRGGPGWPGAQQPDPRIGRPSRSGTIAALLALLVATAAVAPVVAAGALFAWMVLARTTDRSVTSLVVRRHQKGVRRSDVPLAVLASPWHLLVGTLSAVFGAVMPAVIAVAGAFCAALAVVASQGSGSPRPDAFLPLAVGGALAGLLAWWGPGGAGLRRGTRSLVRGMSPGPSGSRVLVLLLLVAAGAAVAVGLSEGQPSWWPTTSPWADGSVLP